MQASVMPERLISTSWSALWLRSNVQQAPMTHDPDAGCRLKQPKRSAEFHNTIRRRERQPHQHGSLQHGLYCALCAAMCLSIRPAAAKEATINARVYATDSTIGNITSVAAGQTFAINFLMTDRATNATIGTILGFCVALRPQGQPCMCQSTGQLASGTLQVIGQAMICS